MVVRPAPKVRSTAWLPPHEKIVFAHGVASMLTVVGMAAGAEAEL